MTYEGEAIPQMRDTRTQDMGLRKTKVVQPTGTKLATSQEASSMASKAIDQRNQYRICS